jgi:hypothetical protein
MPRLEKRGMVNQLPLTIKPYHQYKDETFFKKVAE